MDDSADRATAQRVYQAFEALLAGGIGAGMEGVRGTRPARAFPSSPGRGRSPRRSERLSTAKEPIKATLTSGGPKKRGRPPKSGKGPQSQSQVGKGPQSGSTPAKKRGRPFKATSNAGTRGTTTTRRSTTITTSTAGSKRRGRPPKSQVGADSGVKKPRGRPSKSQASVEAGIKKPRGRPSKSQASGETGVKKPRGRPRKQAAISQTKSTQGSAKEGPKKRGPPHKRGRLDEETSTQESQQPCNDEPMLQREPLPHEEGTQDGSSSRIQEEGGQEVNDNIITPDPLALDNEEQLPAP